MSRWLPALYLPFLALQAVVLTVVYAVWAPPASSLLGALLGIVGLGCMIVMLVYSIARRSRVLRQLFRLSTWLHLHIFLGLQGVLAAFFHSVPWFLRIPDVHLLNPGVLNLIAVMIVFFSGIFGRYLYAQVPKTLGGKHLARKELDAELEAHDVPDEVAALWTGATATRGLIGIVRADAQRRSALRRLRGMDLPAETRTLAARRLVLERQKTMLDVAGRWFATSILLHRPLAAALYVLSFVHVALAILFTPHLFAL